MYLCFPLQKMARPLPSNISNRTKKLVQLALAESMFLYYSYYMMFSDLFLTDLSVIMFQVNGNSHMFNLKNK